MQKVVMYLLPAGLLMVFFSILVTRIIVGVGLIVIIIFDSYFSITATILFLRPVRNFHFYL